METKKTLTESLCEVQGALKAPKGQYNSFGKYAKTSRVKASLIIKNK